MSAVEWRGPMGEFAGDEYLVGTRTDVSYVRSPIRYRFACVT